MTPESAPIFPGSPADPMAGPRGAARRADPRAVRGAAQGVADRITAGRTAVGRVTRRAALAALAGIPALAACTRIDGAASSTPTGAPPPAVGSMVPEVRDLKVDVKPPNQGEEGWSVTLMPQEGLKNDRTVVLPSQSGPLVALVSKYHDESRGNSPDSPDAALMSFDPADGSLTWARLVTLPGGAAPHWGADLGRLDYQVREAAGRSAVAVSPDGRHVCVIVRAHVSSVLSEHVSAAAVLDATSGRVVRAEEIRGFVVAQALTDDALIVQTSNTPTRAPTMSSPGRAPAPARTREARAAPVPRSPPSPWPTPRPRPPRGRRPCGCWERPTTPSSWAPPASAPNAPRGTAWATGPPSRPPRVRPPGRSTASTPSTPADSSSASPAGRRTTTSSRARLRARTRT